MKCWIKPWANRKAPNRGASGLPNEDAKCNIPILNALWSGAEMSEMKAFKLMLIAPNPPIFIRIRIKRINDLCQFPRQKAIFKLLEYYSIGLQNLNFFLKCLKQTWIMWRQRVQQVRCIEKSHNSSGLPIRLNNGC